MPGCTNRSTTSRPSSTNSTATASSPPRSARPPGSLLETATPEKKEQLRSPSRAQDPTETVPVKPGPAHTSPTTRSPATPPSQLPRPAEPDALDGLTDTLAWFRN